MGVLWKDRWYQGRILKVHPDQRYRITYIGWSRLWNETVDPGRRRSPDRGFTGGTGGGPLVALAGIALLVGIAFALAESC